MDAGGRAQRALSIAATAVCLAACSGNAGEDGGANDAGPMDAGALDAGADAASDAASDAPSDAPDDAGPWRPGGRLFNFRVDLHDFDDHVGELFVLRVVEVTSSVAHAVAILDGVRGADEAFAMPLAIPFGHHNAELYADHDGDRTYDPPPVDHVWRLHVHAQGADGPDVPLDFPHDTLFSDIETLPVAPLGGDLRVDFSGFGPEVGRMLELRLIETDTGRTSALYRLAAIEGDDFAIIVPGIVRDAIPYDIDFFVDVDGNGVYDAPPVDHAWRISTEGGSTGLAVSFGHHLEFTDVGF